jgi:hypothetical protein
MNKISLIILTLFTISVEAKIVAKNTYYEDNKIEWKRYYEKGNRENIHKHYDKLENLDIEEKYEKGKLKGISIISHGTDIHWKNTNY